MPMPLKVTEASGHKLEVRGICNLSILVGGQELECIIVTGNMPNILGMNFMHEFKVHADFGT